MNFRHWMTTFLAGIWIGVAAREPEPITVMVAIAFMIHSIAFPYIDAWFYRQGERLRDRLFGKSF